MNSKRRILLFTLFVTLLGGTAWLVLPPRDPLFQGKPESYWIEHLCDGKFSIAREQLEQWRKFGPDGVRVLVRALNNADRPLERTYLAAWRKMGTILPVGLIRRLPLPRNDPTRLTRQCVADLLWRLGEDAQIAVPVMARTFHEDEDEMVRLYAMHFFTAGGVGGENAHLNRMSKAERRKLLPDFIRAMNGDASDLQYLAAVALQYYPDEREVVGPVLLKKLWLGLRTVPDEQWSDSIPDLAGWSLRVHFAARESLKRISPDAQWASGLLKRMIDSKLVANQGVAE